MRRNNIELQKPIGNNKCFSIVKYEPNYYYNNEKNYVKDGEWYKISDNHRIHENCFINPESRYVIAFIEDGIVDFVGDRAIELESMQEMVDFLFILRSGIKKSINYKI